MIQEDAEETNAALEAEAALRRKEIADLQESIEKAEAAAAEAERKAVHFKIKLVNNKLSGTPGLNDCTVTLHGDLGDAPPVTLSERDLWKDGKSWEFPVRCPETLGALGMVSIDDGAGGGVAAKYLKRVVVMRRKSYDPAVIFSNPHSAECEGKPTPFDPKTRVLRVMVDPPPLKEDAEEPQAADA